MTARSTGQNEWTLVGCIPCTEEIRGAVYLYGFGYVTESGDDETRIFRVENGNLKRIYE